MSRIAIVDVGTHSILYLLIETKSKDRLTPVYQEVQSVRLGRKVDNREIIQKDPLIKAIQILNNYRDLALKQKAEQIVVVGTQVFRTAQNRETIRGIMCRKTGLNIEILTEKEEAKWSYLGAVYGWSLSGVILVADIGGGSTEVVLGIGSEITELKSIKLGAVGLTERFVHHDPPLPDECVEMEKYVSSVLKNQVSFFLQRGKHLISVGGTVTTLAALNLKLRKYDSDRIDGHTMPLSYIENIVDKLKKMSLAKRQKLLTLDTARADIILAGTIILKNLMELGKFDEVTVSDRGLRFGIALKELNLLSSE